MGKLKTVVVKYWKVYAAALVIAVICDLIGTVKLNIGIGTLTIFPMVFATIIGGILGPDAFKLFKVPESRLGAAWCWWCSRRLWPKWGFRPAPICQNLSPWDRR